MEVILTENYTNKIKEEITDLVIEVMKHEAEKLAPPKRYYNRTDLMKFLSIGSKKLQLLKDNGLKTVILGQGGGHLYDIEEVYKIFDTLKV